MSEYKRYYWLISLLGGVISLFCFLTPAWYSPPFWIENIWIFGVIHHVNNSVVEIAPTEMFIPSIIATVLISLCSILIILSASLKIKDKRLLGNSENLWIILAILEIGVTIYYIFGFQNAFFVLTNLNFEEYYEIRFGSIIPFIGGSLTLIGAILGKLIHRKINHSNNQIN